MKKFIIFLLIALAAAGITRAETDIIPSLKITGIFDDNIYLDPDEKVSSAVTLIGASMKTFNDKEKYGFSFNGLGNYLIYTEDPGRNNDQHVILDMGARYNADGGLTFTLNDKFYDTSDPASSELVERAKRIQNNAVLKTTYKVSDKTNLELSGSYMLHSYEHSSYDPYERTHTGGSLTGYYKFQPKTSLLIKTGMTMINYKSGTNDSSNIDMEAGIKGELTSKLTALITGGYQIRTYDSDLNDDVSTTLAKLDLTHKYSSKTTIKAGGGYSIKESFTSGSPYYKSLSANVQVDQKLVRRLSAVVRADYISNAYPEETLVDGELKKLSDNIIGGSLKLNYSLHKWWRGILGFYFRNRSSVDSNREYTNSRISMQIESRFK